MPHFREVPNLPSKGPGPSDDSDAVLFLGGIVFLYLTCGTESFTWRLKFGPEPSRANKLKGLPRIQIKRLLSSYATVQLASCSCTVLYYTVQLYWAVLYMWGVTCKNNQPRPLMVARWCWSCYYCWSRAVTSSKQEPCYTQIYLFALQLQKLNKDQGI